MRDLIRKILKENTDYEIVKRTVIKQLEKKVKSGEVPSLNYNYLQKIGLGNFEDEIRQIYFDFVGGEEEAFKLFKKYLEGKVITDVDIRNIGRNVFPQDKYEFQITRIYNSDYRGNRIIGNNEELEFGFELLNGQFDTSEGIMTLDELIEERYDDIWLDVGDVLRSEIEDYVESVSNNFGLEFDTITSHWDD
jgi:hypothetical protein